MPAGFRKISHPAGTEARTLFQTICAVLFWIITQTAYAFDQLGLNLDRIEYDSLSADNVSVALIFGHGESATLRISATRLSLSPSLVFEQLEINCKEGSLTAAMLRCSEGIYYAQHQDHGEINGRLSLSYRLDGSAGEIVLDSIAAGDGTIAGNLTFNAGGWEAGIQGNKLALTWLRKIVEPFGVWPPDYSDERGSVDVDARIQGRHADVHHVQGIIRTHAISFYGVNAAENLSSEVSFDVNALEGWDIKAGGNLGNGALYVEPGISMGNVRPGIALEITDQPLRFAVDMHLDRSLQQVNLHRLDISHPGVMTARVQVEAELGEEININRADIALTATDAGKFYTTWLQPFLLDTQFNALEIAGALETKVRITANELRHLDLHFDDLHAYDGNGRFHIAGLDGAFRVTDEAIPIQSGMSWRGAGIYRIDIGAGKLALESRDQTVNIISWEDVPVLDGMLQIDAFNIINVGRNDMTIRIDGSLTPISMTDFTQAMDWPIMSGQLTGAINGLTYSQGNLVVDGQINLGLFDGNVVVRNLRIEDLFGLAPALYADIDIDKLDLELLTGHFSFGKIQGLISGGVNKLELKAWQPVYFEAALATPENDQTRHRISQQAVDNLGYIGGGAVSALSSGFLRIFKEYSYGRLGISCRLYNGSCEMGGVGDTPEGFIIVSRGGLLPPWIEVKGTGHSITWVALVEGLKTISSNRPEFK